MGKQKELSQLVQSLGGVVVGLLPFIILFLINPSELLISVGTVMVLSVGLLFVAIKLSKSEEYKTMGKIMLSFLVITMVLSLIFGACFYSLNSSI
jgi:hypothetical protein